MEIESKEQAYTSPALLSDDEIQRLGIKHSDIELFRRKVYQERFGIDTWYDKLSNCTFKTKIIPIEYEEAQTLLASSIEKSVPHEKQDIIANFQNRLDIEIKKEFPNGAFIKLNTRSPKDVPVWDFESEETQKLIEQEISNIEETQRNDNAITIAFVKATNKSMKVTSGEKAVKLLLKSHRIREDLTKFLEFGKAHFNLKIVIREWIDEVPNLPQMEFRGFVYDNKLNAISQYFSSCQFPDLIQQKEVIQQRILEFFESIKDKLTGHKHYVIDFFVLPDRILIVELNPFHIGAGAGLFSWKEHRELFMHGPFEFRVVEHLKESPKEQIPNGWKKFIDKKFKPTEEVEEEEKKVNYKYGAWTFVAVVVGGWLSYKLYKKWFQK